MLCHGTTSFVPGIGQALIAMLCERVSKEGKKGQGQAYPRPKKKKGWLIRSQAGAKVIIKKAVAYCQWRAATCFAGKQYLFMVTAPQLNWYIVSVWLFICCLLIASLTLAGEWSSLLLYQYVICSEIVSVSGRDGRSSEQLQRVRTWK